MSYEFDDFDDAAADRWNDGALDALRGYNRVSPHDPDYAAGYNEGLEMRKVRPVMVERPEGYYHFPIGTFDPTGEHIDAGLLA